MDDSDRPESQESASNPNHYVKPAVGAVLLVCVAGALWLLPVKQYLVFVLEWTQSLGAWGPIFVAVFYVVAAVLFLPGSVLTLGAGFLFGVPIGLLSAWAGATVGACAAFLVGRTVAREWIARKVAQNPKFFAVDEAVGREGFKIVLLLRLSPVFPFNFLNYALGLTKVSFRQYASRVSHRDAAGRSHVYVLRIGRAVPRRRGSRQGRRRRSWTGFLLGWPGRDHSRDNICHAACSTEPRVSATVWRARDH